MARLLYRLGRSCYRRGGRVAAVWLLVLGAVAAAVLSIGVAPTATVTIPGTEAQRALDALKTEFPQASGAAGTVVLRAPAGTTLQQPAARQVVLGVVQEANQLPGVVGATSPYDTRAISPDGRYALVDVQFQKTADALSDRQRTAYEDLGANPPAGWRIEAGGEPLQAVPAIGSTEAIGVAVALVVLVVTFGSLVAAGMTMLNALLGVALGYLGIVLAGHLADLTEVTPVLALMLGLAVGIDYSLFITSRYRSNLEDGMAPDEAAGHAVGTAGSAVTFAGLTVVIALAGLSVVGIPFLSTMGLAAAGTVAVAVLVALTLLPALLGFAGGRVLPRSRRTSRAHAATSGTTGGFRWAQRVVRGRVPVLVVGILGLGAVAIPAAQMRLALPDDGTAAAGTSKRQAYDLVTEGFGPGFNGRLVVVVSGEKAAVQQAAGVLGQRLQGTRDVLAVAPPQPNADGTTALVAVIPRSGPTADATTTLVRELRRDAVGVGRDTRTDISVTGATAVGIDVSAKLADALPIYLLLVVGLSFLLLMIVFRSLLVPLKATLGFLLTVGATFGATVAVFQWGWLRQLVGLDTAGPLVSFLPILLIGILFGLAMDYEVFLVSRMREDFVHGETARGAITAGVGHGARVVVAAALIMISVFAGFVLVEDPIVKSIGFALAVGVAIDAFVVRLTLVPAVMSFLGERAWWLPRWLDRVLPRVDIEGEGLRDLPAARGPEHTDPALPGCHR